jgi:putative N6-adenine-specific DNA methylase
MIGERFKHQFVGGDAWVLSYREECFEAIGLKPSLRTPLYNGSLECELRKYQIFDGKFNDMRAGGGDIKTAQERRLMADQKRFKQKRDFKTRLGEQPEERELSGDRNFGKGKYAREDRKFGRDDRKFGRDERGFGRKDNADRPFRKDSEERSFKRGGGEGRDFKRGGEGRDFKRGGDKFGKKNFERRNDKTFNKFRRDNED